MEQSQFDDKDESVEAAHFERTGVERLARILAEAKRVQGDFFLLHNKIKQMENNQEEWYIIGNLLQRISRGRLFRSGGYRSFSEYCTRGHGYSRQHIYKLIKVVKYLDKRWSQATDDSERIDIARLYELGFTKIYVLHTLPNSRLSQLLMDGLTGSNRDGEQLTVEIATIEQLRRVITNEPIELVDKLSVVDTVLPSLLARSQDILPLIDLVLSEIGTEHNLRSEITELRTRLQQFLISARKRD